MPSEKKTETLKLNQWQENEYPKMIDFNDDNKKIDNAYIKILQLIADKVNKKDMPKNISELKNDKGYITKEELPEKTDLTPVYEEIDKKANKSALTSYLRKNGEDSSLILGKGQAFETTIKNDEWILKRNRNTGGWAKGLLTFELPDGEIAMRVGGYGIDDKFNCLFFGKGGRVSGWNLTIDPSKDVVNVKNKLTIDNKEVPTKDEVVSSINNKKGHVRLTANDIQMDESTSSPSINYTIKFIADEITDRVPYEVFYNHSDKKIHEDEVHGMKFNDKGKLEVFNGNEWIELKGGGLPVSITRNINVNGGNREVALLWEDPEDVKIDGKTVAKWKSTKIVRKTGSKPKNDEDGILIAQSSIRNQYKDEPFVDNYALQNDVNYYYGIFPVSEDEIVTVSDECIVKAKPTETIAYGFEIDESNLNPETAVKYIGLNSRFTPMKGSNYGDWEEFVKKIATPVLLKDGRTQYELQYDDYTKKKDGSNSNLTGNDGDVMVRFKHIWIKKEQLTDNKRRVWISDEPFEGAKSFTKMTEKGYNLLSWGVVMTLQHLFLLLYKNRDSKNALGQGKLNSYTKKTGETNRKPFFYGNPDNTDEQIKFLGLEGLWGYVHQLIDGIALDFPNGVKIGYKNFNDKGVGYKEKEVNWIDEDKKTGYITKTVGGETGYMPIEFEGSNNTGYCSRVGRGLGDDEIVSVGGTGGNGDGIFSIYYRARGRTEINLGARLCYIDDNFFYVGAYPASLYLGKLRSRSGVIPNKGNTLSDLRERAHMNNGGV